MFLTNTYMRIANPSETAATATSKQVSYMLSLIILFIYLCIHLNSYSKIPI